MPIKAQIENDLKAALLSGNRFKVEVMRGLKAVILNEEVAQNKRESGLEDEAIEKLIAKEVKKRHESAGLYDSAGRPELSEKERSEAEVLLEYLPKQLSKDEIQVVIDRVIAQLNVVDVNGMGPVIGAVKKELGNTADGATISELVKNSLTK
jgi:uncharacterized protein